MARAIVLFRVSNSEIRSRVRRIPNVRTFIPGPPWELGAVVEADSRSGLRIAVREVRSVARLGTTEVFFQPDDVSIEQGDRGPVEPAEVLEGASRILKAGRGEIIVARSSSPESEELAQEVLELDFTDVLRLLQPRQLRQEIANGELDSVMRLMKAVRQLFLDLSKSFEGSVGGREALSGIARDFGKLDPRDAAFLSKLDGIVDELAKIIALRDHFAKDARNGDFESEFIKRIKSGETRGD